MMPTVGPKRLIYPSTRRIHCPWPRFLSNVKLYWHIGSILIFFGTWKSLFGSWIRSIGVSEECLMGLHAWSERVCVLCCRWLQQQLVLPLFIFSFYFSPILFPHILVPLFYHFLSIFSQHSPYIWKHKTLISKIKHFFPSNDFYH